MDPLKSKRMAVMYTVLVLLVLGLFATLALVRRSQEIRQRATGATVLRLDPASQSVEQGTEVLVDVVMDTGENQVTSANISVTYDEAVLDPVSFTAGSFLPVVVQDGIAQSGVANIALASASDLEPVQGSGVVGQLKFIARNPASPTTIEFSENTTITAVDEPENVFVSGESADVTVTRTISPATVLLIDPTTVSVNAGDEFDVVVKMNTGDNQVTGVNLVANYQEALIQGISFTKSDSMPQVLEAAVFSGGSVRVKLGSSTESAVNGNGIILGTIKFKALAGGNSMDLVFNSQSYVTAQGTDENMLADRNSKSSITIVAPPVGGDNPPPNNQNNQNNNGGGNVCTATQPLSPTNLNASVISKNSIELSWDASDNATHYGIVYGLKPGNYIYGASNVGNTTSYQVKGLAANTNYYFAVTAVNNCKSSGFSVETSAKTVLTTAGFDDLADPEYYTEPEPDPLFVPLPPDDSDQEQFVAPSPSPVVRVASPTPRPSVAPASGFGLFSPLGGILLIIAALFLGIFFFRMRSS